MARHLSAAGHQVFATELTLAGVAALRDGVSGTGVTVSLGDGLQPVWHEPVDCVVVAGMGYETILEIVSTHDHIASHPRFIVQPMQGALLLHQAIIEQGWTILQADIAQYRRHLYPTWLLDMYHIDHARDNGPHAQFLPTEFRGSPAYVEWLERERRFRRQALTHRQSTRMRQEVDWLTAEVNSERKRE